MAEHSAIGVVKLLVVGSSLAEDSAWVCDWGWREVPPVVSLVCLGTVLSDVYLIDWVGDDDFDFYGLAAHAKAGGGAYR
jgi:hypothetical protein